MGANRSNARQALALAALGVVFGDIGTSPLYTYQTALAGLHPATSEDAIGVASLIVWSLLIIVTLKYVCVVMRADYHGEGGVFALLALLKEKLPSVPGPGLRGYAVMLLFGAALLYGDGTITPAISVLSAMEGLEAVKVDLKPIVIPATVAILALLFGFQWLGTGRLGRFFGWVMLVWFVVIGILGLYWTVQEPAVLAAFHPLSAIGVLQRCGWSSVYLMGGVVLAVTGVEALYADMGHFSRRAISTAWYFVALPGLVLNYLGQAALVVRHPGDAIVGQTFFHMVPTGPATIGLVILATIATVVASQALISGVFSLTAQARDLGVLPKVRVVHTSVGERGQVFVPFANAVLGATCILLVLTFRSSASMASAYGLAVVGTMVITTIATSMVARVCWRWPLWLVGLFGAGLLSVEGVFLFSSLTKFAQGGYFPLAVAGFLTVVMLTWHRGRAIIEATIRARGLQPAALRLGAGVRAPLPGQMVLVTHQTDTHRAIARLDEMGRQGISMREQTVVLSLISTMKSRVDIASSITAVEGDSGFWHVSAGYGYMQEPDAPAIIREAVRITDNRIHAPGDDTFFVLPRELIIEYAGSSFARWRRGLFGILSRNQSYAPDYFFIPHTQILEFTWMIRA
jgi:KUP system potassium uptake protein